MKFTRGDVLVLVDKYPRVEVHYLVIFREYVPGGAIVTYIGTEENFNMTVEVDDLHFPKGVRKKE